ncbi:hypothetical protein [Botrimarina mediterranea]|uniref:IncA protein n=1 Tax=Botrimarina mediterranea TaxID=2528022 RepID=A0A518K9D9_9BACT|nr:hypothetical protein [Botrimarina mediterranea]QDV74406.1 hypothetical protein Spa11_26090 [Botrimarina mediterranea]QDV79002.1 hypothetical protein K2D_26110 [Planctomycetes bacterium K2D]
MRRSARGEPSAFSLFPFLAVLLCTMGSLVVLLVAMAQISREKAEVEAEAARVAAEAARVDEDSPERRQLESQIVEAAGVLSRLRLAKAEGQQRLRQEQQRLSDIEDHLRRLSDEAEALVAETKELIAVEDEHYDDAKIADQELERLNQLAGEIEDEIEQLKHAAAGRERKFAVVPLRDGRAGTLRPPVYYECTKTGIVLQPEGVHLTWQDLVASDFSSPVNAAARAVSRYYEEHPEARAANESGRPYPLLIVRPDGVLSYYQARLALEGADVDYGYQPVADDWELEYGESNPVLAAQVEDAVRTARAEREGLAKVIPQVGAALASAESEARMVIALSHGQSSDAGAADFAGNTAAGRVATNQTGIRVRPANPRSNNPFEGLRIEGSLPGEVGGSGYSGGMPAASALSEAPVPGAKQSPLITGMPQATEMTPPSAQSAAGSQNIAVSSTGPAGVAATAVEPSSEEEAAVETPGQETGTVATAKASVGAQPPPEDSRSVLATTGVASDPASPKEHGEASVNAGSSRTQAPKNATAGGGAQRQTTTRDGLPMIRPIRLYVSHDRAVVLSDTVRTVSDMERASAGTQAIQFDGATTGQINDLIAVLKQHADTWGMAGDGMYWEPRLVLNVAGNGADRAEDVRCLLEAAGVKVQAYPVTTAANPGGGSDASRR